MTRKRCLYLSGFDTVSPYLYLLIGPPEVLNIAVRQVFCDVASSIEALARSVPKGIGDKSLMSQIGKIMVPTASRHRPASRGISFV
jgi:hypothetical protein